MKKTLLLFGDSIFWSRKPGTTERYENSERMDSLLESLIKESHHVLVEGLRARTLSGENPNYPDRDGAKQFGPIIGSHLPIDTIVICLGTNDVLSGMNKSESETQKALQGYISNIDKWSVAMNMPTPKLLVISPPSINFALAVNPTHIDEAKRAMDSLREGLKRACKLANVPFVDASSVQPSKKDGVHLEPLQNSQLAQLMADALKKQG